MKINKKKVLVWAFLALTSLVLESTVFARMAVFGAKPDLLLVFTVYAGVFGGRAEGVRAGIGLGLVEDLFLGRFLGINALIKGFAGYLAGMVEKEIVKENMFIPVFAVWALSLVHYLGYGMVVILLGHGRTLGLNFLVTALPFALYNSVIAVLLFPLMYVLLVRGVLKPGKPQSKELS